MLKNNIKIGWRNLWRNKSFTAINLGGLALGMAVFILIMEYVSFEWSYNRFNKNFKQLYRASVFHKNNKTGDYYLAPGMAPLIKNNIPGVAKIVRIADGLGRGVVTVRHKGGKGDAVSSFREKNVSFTDDGFFKVFSFPLIAGDASLKLPQSVAISNSIAHKYFGDTNAIGQILIVSNQFGTTNYTVTGVFTDFPEQSDIKADILLSLKTLESAAFRNHNDWADPNGTGSGYAFLYLLLNNTSSSDLLAAQITAYFHKMMPDSKDDQISLQPIKNLHLAPNFSYNYQTYGSTVLVISLLSIAIIILIVAWVNYINLSTAQALNRAREVGVRKILGAGKRQVIGLQFVETCLLMFMSIAGALFLIRMIQPLYNNFIGHILSLSVLNNGWFWLMTVVLIVGGTLIAGIYIALILSSFNPLKTLKGKAAVTIAGVSLKKGLVVFQFTVSVFFIIGTITLYRQLNFMQTSDLGFSTQQLVVITGPELANSGAAAASFKNDLSAMPFVIKYSSSNNVPGQGYNFSTQGITKLSSKPGDDKKGYNMLIVDDKYFDTYGIKIKEGTVFTPVMASQGWSKIKKVILNQAAVKQLGFKDKEQVVGQQIKWGDNYEVVGVVKDYHHFSLHTLIEPMIFLPAVGTGYFTVKMDAANMVEKIIRIRTLYQQTFPGEPFNYSFVDETFDQQYKNEYKMGQLFISSAGIAIFIACLGLFGLAAYAAKQRTKEIGIRKVLGATVINITALLSGDFIKLVIIAVLIASPLSWFTMQKWLQSFAYHINMQLWIFMFAGMVIALIAFATISFQAIKAALANPVKSLRSE